LLLNSRKQTKKLASFTLIDQP